MGDPADDQAANEWSQEVKQEKWVRAVKAGFCTPEEREYVRSIDMTPTEYVEDLVQRLKRLDDKLSRKCISTDDEGLLVINIPRLVEIEQSQKEK